MLRVLTLSTLFPNQVEPILGGFVARQTLGLAALEDVAVEVVAPIGFGPWPLSRHPHYARRAGLAEQETWNGLTVHRPRYRVVPGWGARWTARAMARALLPKLRGIRKRFPFDVIDAEFFWPDGPAAMHLARALGVPFSIKARGSDIQLWGMRAGIGPQLVAAGREADGMLAVSGALRSAMASLGIEAGKVRVHHTGVDLDRFRPADRRVAKAALGVDGPLLASVGALIPRKGQRLALATLAELPSATLIFAGDGPDRAALEAEARRLRVADRTRFLGAQPHDAVARLIAAADVMVLPTSAEGLANVWVEALASGTPVVTSDVGGARDVVDRPEAGRLVPLEPSAIAAAVRDLLAEPPPQEAVRRAAERFRWERNALELRDHLRGLVSGTASKAA
ncbi:glycosyltransferase [Allosphingosinicella humi]